MTRSNLPSLTGVRGVAALWVMLFHVQFFSGGYGAGWMKTVPLLQWGWAGVDLFFVLSGFILMHVHRGDFERPDVRRTARFAVLRVFRVYPLATVVLLIIGLMVLSDSRFVPWYIKTHETNDLSLAAFIRTLTLSTRWFPPFKGDWNQPTWSLSAEIIGYCAFPLLAFVAVRVRAWWLLAITAVMALEAPFLLRDVFNSRLDNDIFGYAVVRMGGCFIGGIALYRLHEMVPERLRSLQGHFATLALVVLIASLLSPLQTGLANLCFGAIIFGIAAERGLAAWLFAHPVSLFLGRISFPLYLLHVMPLFYVYFELGQAQVAAETRPWVLLALLVALVMASLALHVLVERPAQKLGRRIADRIGRREPVPPVAEPARVR